MDNDARRIDDVLERVGADFFEVFEGQLHQMGGIEVGDPVPNRVLREAVCAFLPERAGCLPTPAGADIVTSASWIGSIGADSPHWESGAIFPEQSYRTWVVHPSVMVD